MYACVCVGGLPCVAAVPHSEGARAPILSVCVHTVHGRCAAGHAERTVLAEDIAHQCMERLWQRQVAARAWCANAV